MRQIILLLAVIGVSKTLFAQQEDHATISQNIASAFSTRYPGVPVQEWSPVAGGYTAKFFLDGKKSLAYYSANGDWIKTERKIKWTRNLPPSVKKGWEKAGYAHWYVDEIKEIHAPGEQIYVMAVNNGPTLPAEGYYFKEEHKLYFSVSGDLVKKETGSWQ